jgi:hypothetical protein
MQIEDYLKTGKDNAISGRELRAIYKCSARDVCRMIQIARTERKAPICASAKKPWGYYLAKDEAELLEYCGRLGHRVRELMDVQRTLVNSTLGSKELEGQLSLLNAQTDI